MGSTQGNHVPNTLEWRSPHAEITCTRPMVAQAVANLCHVTAMAGRVTVAVNFEAMNIPHSSIRSCPSGCSTSGWLLAAVVAFGLAAPAQAFVFDTYGDGFWTVINQGNGKNLIVSSSGASQAASDPAAFTQQFELLYNNQNSTFRLRNHSSWLCIGAQNGANTNGTPVVAVSSYTGAASMQWNFVDVGSGNFRIVNLASGLALQTDNGSPAQVTLATASNSSYQYWHFAYQTHYPKKGMAGWDSQTPRFNVSWLYNWGWGTSQSLTPSQVFEPMQWGNWNVDSSTYTAWHSTEKPMYVLGFNEPDHTDQANMTTDQAIALWPQLQAMNLPLVSPACANDFGGWLSDFYTKIAAKGYRVDFTAVHSYPGPYASSLMSTLQSVYNTWGRAVWLTEFAVVDWGGTATWSEQDNYRFLAEFMWQAEDQVWFKRYALYVFSGTPSSNPWDGNGHRSDVFLTDNYTLTPFGELFAAWDADRTLHPLTPYFIHNCATCFRMTSARDRGGPVAFSIRHEDASMQWALTNAPTNGRFYIMSPGDGRRLRYSGGVLDLAPPGTTGATLEWSFNGPDGNGYYYIDNPNGSVSLSGSGSGGSVSISAVASGSASDNTRWRFVKPYYPVSLAAITAPTALSAAPADCSVTLRWTGTAPRYHVYRSPTSGTGYARVASDIKRNYYTDNGTANGTTYYYVVTAVDSLESESSYSNQAVAAPVSGLGLGLVAEYKFENSVQDSSGNGFHGTAYGTTSFIAGKVDSSAVSFSGGDNSYVEIPNPLGNDFTIAFWLNTTASGGTGQWWAGNGLVDGEVPGTTNDFGVSLVGSYVGFGVGNSDVTITSSTAVNDGQWHHVAATRNSTSGLMQLYVDGTLRASGSGPTGTRATPASLHLGNIQSGFNYLSGAMDEVRLYNYALSAAQVKTLATVSSTLVAEYSLEGKALDSTGFGNNGMTNGGLTYVTGKVGSLAAQFDGTNAYVQIPVSVANDFSIAGWVKTTATGGSGQWWAGKGIVDGEMAGALADFGLALVGSKAAFGIGNSDTTITSTSAVNNGQWHHVAATRNNTSGAMRLYVDGALQATATGPTGTRSAPTALRLGSIQTGSAAGFLSGALDEVRLYNYELCANQVAALFSPQPLPSPWANADIGSPGSPGYAGYNSSSGLWSLGGGGADIWLTSDQFQFAYQNLSGSGSLVARLTSGAILSDGTTNANAKAGIMFRDSLAANAAFVALVHDQGQGVQLLYRDSAGAAAGQEGASLSLNPPVWLRLVRSNDTFRAYYGLTVSPPTSANWLLLGSHTTTIATSAFAGVFACSHDNTKLANTAYTGVSVSPPTPPTISSVADQTISENTSTAVLPVTVGDALVPPANLVLTASSSDTNLVPNANIVLGGTGAYRNVQVTPAAYQAGTCVITLVVNNNQPTANTATNSFLFTVQTTPAGYWREQYFGTTANTGTAADGAAPAGDGIINVLKRFLGLNPLVSYPQSVLPAGAMEGTNFTMSYTHSLLATDLLYQVWWSPDLLSWQTNDITDNSVSTNGDTELRAGSVPATTADPLFLRLRMTSP